MNGVIEGSVGGALVQFVLFLIFQQGHLVGYMLELSRQPCFSSTFVPQLTRDELRTLSKVGIPTS